MHSSLNQTFIFIFLLFFSNVLAFFLSLHYIDFISALQKIFKFQLNSYHVKWPQKNPPVVCGDNCGVCSQVLTILQEVFPAVKTAEMVVKFRPLWWEGWQTLGRAQLNLGEVDMVSDAKRWQQTKTVMYLRANQ